MVALHFEKIKKVSSPGELLASPKGILRRLGETGIRAAVVTKEAHNAAQLSFTGKHALREDHPTQRPVKKILKFRGFTVDPTLSHGRHAASAENHMPPLDVDTIRRRNLSPEERAKEDALKAIQANVYTHKLITHVSQEEAINAAYRHPNSAHE